MGKENSEILGWQDWKTNHFDNNENYLILR